MTGTTDDTLSTVVLRHVSFEDAGTWEELLQPRHVDAGVDFPPGPLEADLLVVMGGPVAGGERLAHDEDTPVQAFRSNHALGLQFHPEVDPDTFERWLIGHHGDLQEQGVDVDVLRRATAQEGPGLVEPSRRMVLGWLRTVGLID
ncbi:MAG: hypothetical protein L0J86_04885 [Corynebacterium sp.]|nr:hypothetical protein [Corynebacterium sp.]